MVLTPPLAALLAEGPDAWGLLAIQGWFAAYALRGPLESLTGRGASGRAGMAQADPPVARFWLLLFGLLAVGGLGPVALTRPGVILLLAGAGVLLGSVYWLAVRGETRSLLAGFLAVIGLMAGGPLYYLAATGSVPPAGWAVAYGCFAFFGGSVLRVKALGRERRSAGFRWLSPAIHLVFVGIAGLAAWWGWTPTLLAVSLAPSLIWSVYGAWRGGHGPAANLGAVGRSEIGLTLLFALLLIIALRI